MEQDQYSEYIPKIAYNYVPLQNELINLLLNKPARRIFKCPEASLNQTEINAIQSISPEMKAKDLTLPKWWTPEETLRHLQGCDYDIDKAISSILYAIQWKSRYIQYSPIPDDVHCILNSGFLYIHGRDNRFRPLVFVNPARYEAKKYSFATYERAIGVFVEFVIDKLFIPGKIENWDMIVDLSEMSLLSIPYDLKELHKSVKEVYKCRLFKLFVLNLPNWLLWTWKIAKVFMGVTIESKVCMAEYDYGRFDQVFEFINRKQVEQKYGGEADNVTKGYFFPPKFNCDEYFMDTNEDNDLQQLLSQNSNQISEDDYKEIE